jgi:hypothetical protein
MFELRSSGFLTLEHENVVRNVPARPGVYMLAVRLPNGVHSCFHTSQTENLQRSLKVLITMEAVHLPAEAKEIMRRFQCYFTFFVIVNDDYREEINKILANTVDPVLKLTLVPAN